MDEVNEKVIAVIIGCPILGSAYVSEGGPMVGGAILLLIASGAAILVGIRVRKQLKESWAYRLGARGEQIVARELDRLMAHGYQVYHDVRFDDYKWNIDHVVIGPRGVFAVETKAWRKPPKEKGSKPEVILNGTQLTWPGKHPKSDPIAQADRNGHSLEREIAQRAGERTEVIPVVALPGWFVRIEKFGKVAVYSAKDMGEAMIQRGRAQLSPDQIVRIGFVVRQACLVKPA